MGLKGSKQLIISYEDAIKRLSDAEASRIKDAFRRLSGTSAVLAKTVFMRDVLGDNVPPALAEHIFTLYGGTARGLGWKDLVCGLVLLTRGTREERTQFAYAVFASGNEGALVAREDIERLLIQVEGSVPRQVRSLFAKGNEVTYEAFASWIAEYPDATSVTSWLIHEPRPISLSNEVESPTFYQTLAGVTHLEESEILELEKAYISIERLGRFDLQFFMELVTLPFPFSHAELGRKLCEGLFYALDENKDLHIDFKEEVCGMSAACRGPIAERLKFAFKIWDWGRDGFITLETLREMILTFVVVDNLGKDLSDVDFDSEVETVLTSISSKYDLAGDFSAEDFLFWSVGDSLAHSFVAFVSQIFTVYFGLKPSNRREEGEVVLGWLRLRKKNPPIAPQLWYLIAIDWWKGWLDYVLLEHQSYEVPSTLSSLIRPSASAASLVSFASALTDNGDDNKSNVSLRHSDRKVYSKPRPIENSCLLASDQPKVPKLTNDGGILKKALVEEKDFEYVPKELWLCLSSWYGSALTIPRTLRPKNGKYEIELYPVLLKISRHSQAPISLPPPTTGVGMMGAIGAVAMTGGYGYFSPSPARPQRYLAYAACFNQGATIGQIMSYLSGKLNLSYDNFRLWHMKDNELVLLDNESITLESLEFREEQILLEVRSSDQTWPEEIGSLAAGNSTITRNDRNVKNGTTGLYNLGNTCFMNSALQCVSNTKTLTQYFLSSNYVKELNRTNPLGMKGQIAVQYGDLIKNLWEGFCRNTSPGLLRDTIYKYAPRFGDCQQHDAQELLAFLLDGLHEDLNRITEKPYVELKDSDGRPDVDVACEAWDNHLRRNRSVIVDLFHGQLKSKLTCATCGRESVRFDPFTYLSLPLPLDNFIHVEVLYIPIDGGTPTKYGILVEAGSHYKHILEKIAVLTGRRLDQLKLAYVGASRVQTFPEETEKVMNTPMTSILFAYEIIAFSDWPESPVGSPVSFRNVGHTLPEIQRLSRQASAPLPLLSRQSVTSRIQEDPPTRQEEVSGSARICMTVSSMLCRKSSSVRISTISMPKRPSREVAAAEVNVELSTINHIGSDPDLIKRLSSDSSSSKSTLSQKSTASTPIIWKGYLIAYHRRMIRQDVYFISPNNVLPNLFGVPLLIPFYPGRSSGQDLFKTVWNLVSRLVSPLPTTEGNAAANHAQDCDDSLGYEYPFVLKAVSEDGLSCSWCPWWKYCRGCDIPCDSQPLFCSPLSEEIPSPVFDTSRLEGLHIAVEWDPTALHLRYQTSLEKAAKEHSSVVESSRQMTEPVNLRRCLEAFTLEERLSDEEKVYCPNCRDHQNAVKKLQIWRLPPILIIHLKRFQLIGGRWMKSPKAVHFTMDPLDPSEYLAAVPRQAVLGRKRKANGIDHNDNTHAFLSDSTFSRSTLSPRSEEQDSGFGDSQEPIANGHVPGQRQRVESTSLLSHPPSKWATIQDFHEHNLIPGHDPLDLSYRLYAAVCHNGIMGGGHYVAYACHEDDKWYCYNDSSCKEVQPTQIDPHDIYMLFYERIGLDSSKYTNAEISEEEQEESLSSATSNLDETTKTTDQSESDKKNCNIM